MKYQTTLLQPYPYFSSPYHTKRYRCRQRLHHYKGLNCSDMHRHRISVVIVLVIVIITIFVIVMAIITMKGYKRS